MRRFQHLALGVGLAALLAAGAYWQMRWSSERAASEALEEKSRWPLSRWCQEPKPALGEYVALGVPPPPPPVALVPKKPPGPHAVSLVRCDGTFRHSGVGVSLVAAAGAAPRGCPRRPVSAAFGAILSRVWKVADTACVSVHLYAESAERLVGLLARLRKLEKAHVKAP